MEQVQSGRFQAQPIKRSQGRSILAAAAYRAGVSLEHAASEEVFDYSRRKGVEASEVLVPDGAPSWMADREMLWNHVELIEKRKDAQLARELQIALPEALPPETRHQLVWDFCRQHILPLGMVADIAIHRPGRGDQRNHHAHVLLTLRELTSDGFGKKARAWNDNAVLAGWKTAWEAACNTALAEAGKDVRLDHRNLVTRRRELLDQAAAATDLLERNRLLVAAERLDYTPRPYLPPKIYEAMVEGRDTIDGYPITDQQRAYMALWQAAMDSRKDAAARADALERKLAEDLKAARTEAKAILLGDLKGGYTFTEATLAILATQDTHDPAVATALDDLGIPGHRDPRRVLAAFRTAPRSRQFTLHDDTLPASQLFRDLFDGLLRASVTRQDPLPYRQVMVELSEQLRGILRHAVIVLTRLIFTERNPLPAPPPQETTTGPDVASLRTDIPEPQEPPSPPAPSGASPGL
jgi:hypothetical protein